MDLALRGSPVHRCECRQVPHEPWAWLQFRQGGMAGSSQGVQARRSRGGGGALPPCHSLSTHVHSLLTRSVPVCCSDPGQGRLGEGGGFRE